MSTKRSNPVEEQKQRQVVADSLAADSVAAEQRYQRQRAEGLRRLNSPAPKKKSGPIEGVVEIVKGVHGAYKKAADALTKSTKK